MMQVRDLALVSGNVDGGPSELDPPLGIGDHGPHELPEPPHGLGRDESPLEVEAAGHDPPPVALVTQAVGCAYPDVVEVEHSVLDVTEADDFV